jgi:dephospho-CoA kinase
MFSYIIDLFLTIYLLLIFLFFLLFYICLPRIKALNIAIPSYYYLAFYIISSLILNIVFSVKPILSIFIHLVILLLSNFIAVRLRVMGLTGQICSGKSTVAKFLTEKYKAHVIDIDKLNRDVLEYDEVKKEIRKKFGDDVFDEKNQLYRMKMRKIIFSDIEKRRQLEKITHSRVFRLLIKAILKEKILYGTKYVIIENAILLRLKVLKLICYPIISVVTNNRAEVLKRIINRDKCDLKIAENILENQMKIEEFAGQSEYMIINDEGKERLEEEVDKIFRVIK